MLKSSFAPAVLPDCSALVLGSLPGEASLRMEQYYAYPRNAFWKIMGRLCGFQPEIPYTDRLRLLNMSGIALWDMVLSGKRSGSLDSDIRDVRPNDIGAFLRMYPSIRTVCCNGGASHRFLKRYFPELFSGDACCVHLLPSTSPAAARLGFEEKFRAYEEVLQPLVRRHS